MDGVKAVCAGGDNTVALKIDGTVWTWGANRHGQIGDGTKTDKSKPVKVMEDVIAIDTTGTTTAAIKTDGSLWI